MRIIEKVEISKFRSIGLLESFETLELNVFSGSNDSGKSNYLKALNLFFNGQTEINVRYSSDSDFNKWYRDNNVRGERNIEIKLFISKGNYGDKDGINKGFIAKKTFRTDGGYESSFFKLNGTEISQKEKSYNKANAVITEKIRYVYIPTIRDIRFRESVQQMIEEIAASTDNRFKSQDLKEAFERMEVGINKQLIGLIEHVKDKMSIDIETNVNFSTLLESLTFETSEKIKIKRRGRGGLETQKISLKNRGEGIQMQFFSFMLWFISKNDKKHFYIWGYEEPEIAFEFKRQFELAEVFQDTFSQVAQVFLTTHSPAFAFAEGSEMTKVFRVNYEKEKNKSSRYHSVIVPIEEYYEGLFRDLTAASADNRKALERDIWGINAQKISKMIGDSMDEIVGVRHITQNQLVELKNLIASQKRENSDLKVQVDAIERDLKKLFPNKIFICEDSTSIKLWENLLFEKLKLNKESFRIVSSVGCTNTEVETAVLHLIKENPQYRPKIFRQLDRDGFTNRQITFLETKRADNNKYKKFLSYTIKFLPVNEIENFAVLTDSYYTEEKLKEFETSNKITDAFNATVKNNLFNAMKLCDNEEERKQFQNKEAEMIKEARGNMLKYFPGKDIKKIKKNFNCDKVLIGKSYSELPIELREYLINVKNYFEPTA